MHRGYVKLYRKIIDNGIVMIDSDHFAVFAYLMLNAAHKEYRTFFNGSPVTLQPGQVITGRLKLASALKISESKVKRVLKRLESGQLIGQQTTSRGTLVTLINWLEHQKSDQPNGQQMDSQWTASGQRVDTKQECKKVKNEKKKDNPPSVEVAIPESLKTPAFIDTWEAWQKHRREIKKPLKPSTVSMQLKRMEKEGAQRSIEGMTTAIENGWIGIVWDKVGCGKKEDPYANDPYYDSDGNYVGDSGGLTSDL